MRTAGVDLAAEAARTAVAVLEWTPDGASVGCLTLGADDDAIVAAVSASEKAGIDCPLGWPDEFVAFVSAHRAGETTTPQDIAGREWRRRLAYRVTDEAVRRDTGLIPLSVSADRIAHPAIRCAGILARLAGNGEPVDRSGGGVVVEVYPAASLKRWGLAHRNYKRTKNLTGLGQVVDALVAAAPWLRLGQYEELCRRSDDALDAVIAALTARAALLGLTTRPDEQQAPAASTEGWIAVPTAPLDALIMPMSTAT